MRRPPRGVEPFLNWYHYNSDPILIEWLERYQEVVAAIDRYRKAGREPKAEWLSEVGILEFAANSNAYVYQGREPPSWWNKEYNRE